MVWLGGDAARIFLIGAQRVPSGWVFGVGNRYQNFKVELKFPYGQPIALANDGRNTLLPLKGAEVRTPVLCAGVSGAAASRGARDRPRHNRP